MRSEQDPGFGAKLRAVFGLSPTILCLTGLEDGRVRDVNDSFLHTSGFTREEVIGRPMAELGLWLDPEDRAEGLRALRAGQHCAQPLMAALGVDGTLRVSFAPYNNLQDVDALLRAMRSAIDLLSEF